ncbi:MAG: hypothetical protein M3297_08750 [Thermoproteota archaeon]|nr:hypothetical protein [Thermoproteota archaeon]
MACRASLIHGYICVPHERPAAESNDSIDYWKQSFNISDIYFVTATFSSEATPYFPNKAYHYILATFDDFETIMQDIKKISWDKSLFIFNLKDSLFERAANKLNYISMYFTRYKHNEVEISDFANVLARRDRVKRASLADMQFISNGPSKFVFPYSENIVVLEIEGEKTHQSDLKYCDKTRRDVARKGISLNNLVSLSVLDKIK